MPPPKTVQIDIPIEYKPLFETWWRNLLIYGGRFSLKSHTTARALLIRTREEKKRVFCGRELQNSIADSSHQLLSDLIELYGLRDFEITKDSIVNTVTGSDFIFKGLRHNSQSVKSIEGVDIAWIEEAQTISQESIDILTPTVRKPGSQIIWTFNRQTELDPVYQKFALKPRDDTCLLKLNYDIAEKYHWLPKEIKAEIEHDKENYPELYAHKWLGEPMGQNELSILSRTAILEAMQRQITGDGQEEIGVDVARMGDDRTVFWKRKGLKTVKRAVYTKLRTTQICDALEQFADFDKTTPLKIDDTGVGGGVTDEMMKRAYIVVAINFGGMANNSDKYPNWISEAWFHMITILPEAELPMDSDLLMELSTRQWKQDNKGKRRVEGKADYKKRGFRSPDLADACIICYAPPYIPNMLEYYRRQQTDKNTVASP